MYRFSSTLSAVSASPVAEAQSWLEGREFSAEMPLLNLAQAVPSYPPPAEMREYLSTAVKERDSAFYTPIFGLPELRAALAEHMNNHYSAKIDPAEVAIVAGCNQAFCSALTALTNPGDQIVLPLPFYFNHQMWVQGLGGQVIALPFQAQSAGLPDVAECAARITAKTRAIALVSPNNPTGASYPTNLLLAFYELAKQHRIALILDETYKDFAETDQVHTLFQQPDWQSTLIQLYSFSKAFSLTGYRVGSLIGSRDLLAEVSKFQDCVAICAPHIGQLAALYGLRHLDRWCAQNRARILARADYLRAAFSRAELGYQVISCGAFFCYLAHPFGTTSATHVARYLLDTQHILALPGTTFGPGQDRYLRLAFANLETPQIDELVERLRHSERHGPHTQGV